MQIGKEEVKVLLLANGKIIYTRDTKISTRELLQLIKPFS
jgi:Tfp pilus assembly PilM family ATPase